MAKMKKIILFLFLVLVIGFIAQGCGQETTETDDSKSEDIIIPLPDEPTMGPVEKSVVREFIMTAKQWEFEPGTITVNEGDLVRIKVKSLDVPHGFLLPEFGVNERLEPNQEKTIEFVASKKGTFTFRCNIPCGSGHGTMSGTLIVN